MELLGRGLPAQLREQQAEEGIRDEETVGIPIQLKDLNDVLVMDVGDKVRCRRTRVQASACALPQRHANPRAQIRDSGKWPLVIDVSGQASVFLRYLDTNYGAIPHMSGLKRRLFSRVFRKTRAPGGEL